jgi:hypothetical protein
MRVRSHSSVLCVLARLLIITGESECFTWLPISIKILVKLSSYSCGPSVHVQSRYLVFFYSDGSARQITCNVGRSILAWYTVLTTSTAVINALVTVVELAIRPKTSAILQVLNQYHRVEYGRVQIAATWLHSPL